MSEAPTNLWMRKFYSSTDKAEFKGWTSCDAATTGAVEYTRAPQSPANAPETRTSQPDTAKVAVSRETIRLALSAIRANQERDYYHNFAEAQRELELLA